MVLYSALVLTVMLGMYGQTTPPVCCRTANKGLLKIFHSQFMRTRQSSLLPAFNCIACPCGMKTCAPFGMLIPLLRLSMLLSIPAAPLILPAAFINPPARLPPVSLLIVPEISAAMLLVDPATDLNLSTAPPNTLLTVTLPPMALLPKFFASPANWLNPDFAPAAKSETLSSSFTFSIIDEASCRAACPSLVAWLTLSEIPATSCDKGATGLLPGPEDGLPDPPNPKDDVNRSFSDLLLATCVAEIPVGSPLARLILSASSCGVSG